MAVFMEQTFCEEFLFGFIQDGQSIKGSDTSSLSEAISTKQSRVNKKKRYEFLLLCICLLMCWTYIPVVRTQQPTEEGGALTLKSVMTEIFGDLASEFRSLFNNIAKADQLYVLLSWSVKVI
jgi:hypothetical protein